MIKIQIKKLLLVFFFVFYYCTIIGQENTDVQARFYAAADYKITKKWQVAFEYRYAMDHDISEFRNNSFEIGTKYDVAKKMSLETGYRFTTSYEKDSHLLFLSYQYKYKFNKRFTLGSTTRYQFRTLGFDADLMQYYKEPSQFIREKLRLEYNVPKSKASLYFAPEIFLKIDNSLEFNRMRYTLGGDYLLKYGNTLGLSLFYENKYNPQKTDRFVLSTKYNLSIDELIKKINKKKEKKEKNIILN